MYDSLFNWGLQRAKTTIWVLSDLQQSRYENAKRCLYTCMEDFKKLNIPISMVFYLGDSTEGRNLPELYRMTELQEKAFSSLNVPLCYATGNHDYDYAEFCHLEKRSDYKMPFYDMVRSHPGWYTTKSPEETWFKVPYGEYTFYFFTDHIAEDNSWCSTHNHIRWGREFYPYKQEHFDLIRKDMNECDSKYIITAAHCAFPGGNRETEFLSKIQPLPFNVRLHLYGHSHIGEYICPKARIFSQIQWIDWQDIPQVDVASFEDVRGSYCRSVFLQIYDNGETGVFFRNHNSGHFVSAFFPKNSSCEVAGNYERKEIISRAPWD